MSLLAAAALLAGCGDGNGQWPEFTDTGAALPGVYDGSLAWGDYDNDGDLDLAIAGYLTIDEYIARVYRNDGDGSYTDISAVLEGLWLCSLAWGDYDGDGDLDLALAGEDVDGFRRSRIYSNDGGGVFTDITAAVTQVELCSLAWGDCDNDGDLDLALAGRDGLDSRASKVYRNQGGGVFAEIASGLTGVESCSLAWGDFDNDGDLDLALAGGTDGGSFVSRVFRNDGGGGFDIAADLIGVIGASISWGDHDNDGDLDLALAGGSIAVTSSKVYQNDGGMFVEVASDLTEVAPSSLAWGDYDNDGDLDLALAGETTALAPASKIYRNEGGAFIDIAATIEPVKFCSLAWGDYDNDGDLDLVLTGEDEDATLVTKLYRNETQRRNTLPTAPPALASSVLGSDVILSWNAAFDEETPTAGLSYNLRVWPESGTEDVVPGMADPATGYRRIPALGNAQKRLFWILKGLPSGIYYWTVQAIDSTYAGGPWAPEGTVTVP